MKISLVLLAVLLISTFVFGGCDIITARHPETVPPEYPIFTLSGLNPIPASEPEFVTDNLTEVDRQIIKLILTSHYEDGGYNIINPEMSLAGATSNLAAVDYITSYFNERGIDVFSLLVKFYARNWEPVRMDIPSSISNGYIIDYQNKFNTYLGWEEFREANPKVHSYVSISLPVYDPDTNLVLVYLSWSGGLLLASGGLRAYKYDGDTFEEIANLNLWIS
jgi:hypothetical protein